MLFLTILYLLQVKNKPHGGATNCEFIIDPGEKHHGRLHEQWGLWVIVHLGLHL
jgi:hypothetical protein